jgi:hypothetical protein
MLPAKLKRLNLFLNGSNYAGEAKSVKLPNIKYKTEGYRGGSMSGEIKWRSGLDDTKLEFTLGGLSAATIRAIGSTQLDGNQLRFSGAYQNDQTGQISSVEIIVQGQINETDFGDAEIGKDTEHKYTVDWVYYKLTIDGADVVEIDIINGIEKFDGVDQAAALRAAAGG